MTGNTLNGRSLPGAQVYRSSEKNKHLKYLSAQKNCSVICHVVVPNRFLALTFLEFIVTVQYCTPQY